MVHNFLDKRIRTGNLTIESPWSYPLSHDNSASCVHLNLSHSYKQTCPKKTFEQKAVRRFFVQTCELWHRYFTTGGMGVGVIAYQVYHPFPPLQKVAIV